MLEFSLRQERIGSSKNPNGINQKDSLSQFFNEGTDFALNNALSNNETANASFPKRKARSHKPLLAKLHFNLWILSWFFFRFLEEIGFDDIFSSLNEQENNKSLNFSNFSNHKNENNQDFEKNLTSTPQTQKEPSFGTQFEGLPPKKPASRDITPTNKQRQNAILDKSPQNTSVQEKISKKYEDSSKITPSYKTVNFEAKCSLKSHLDGVRDIFFYNNDDVLISVSEDCLIKLWDLKAIENYKENNLIDPYFSLRGLKFIKSYILSMFFFRTHWTSFYNHRKWFGG